MASLPSSSPSQVMPAPMSPVDVTDLTKLWAEAVQHFHENLGPETSIITNPLLMHHKTGTSVVDVLLDSFQIMNPDVERRWSKAQKSLAVVLDTMITLEKKLAPWVSLPDRNVIFVAFGVLLKATNGLSDGSDHIEMLQELLDKFLELFQGLEICRRQTVPLNDTVILVKILAELLNVASLSIKALQKNDGSRRKILENEDVETALTRLERLVNAFVKADLLALNSTVWTSLNSNFTMINKTVSDMETCPAVISVNTAPVTATAQIFPNAHQLDINGGTYSSVARDQIINIHPNLPVTTTIPISHPLNGNRTKHVNRELVFLASYIYHVRAIMDCRLPNMQDKLIALSAMLGSILTAPGVPISIKLKLIQVFMFLVFGFTFMDRCLMPAGVITVIDVYGGCFCIPLEHGRDWIRLNREILNWFGSKPQLHKALAYLRRKLYQLQDSSQEGQVFHESNWCPGNGMIIEIAIILSWNIGPSISCPRCSVSIHYNRTGSQSNLKCPNCYTYLSTSDNFNATDTPSLPLESQQVTMDGSPDHVEPNDMGAGDEPKEIDFRKLHLTHRPDPGFPAMVDLSRAKEKADDDPSGLGSRMHHLLTYSHHPAINYDVSLPTSMIKTFHSGLSFSEPAVYPPVSSLVIQIPQHSWSISVHASYNGQYVTVGDVFTEIYHSLRTNVSHSEYRAIPSRKDAEKVRMAYETRYRRLRDRYAYEAEKMQGVKRVDFLNGHTHFMGLTTSTHVSNVWVLHLA